VGEDGAAGTETFWRESSAGVMHSKKRAAVGRMNLLRVTGLMYCDYFVNRRLEMARSMTFS